MLTSTHASVRFPPRSITTPPPNLELRQQQYDIIGYSWFEEAWSPITCQDSKTVWTSQPGVWGCSGSNDRADFTPATSCSTDAEGTQYIIPPGTARDPTQCPTKLFCYTGTIFNFPDSPGDTRTGVDCYSKRLDNIIVYSNTQTGIASLDFSGGPSQGTTPSRILPTSATSSRGVGDKSSQSLQPAATTANDSGGGLSPSDKIALGVGLGVGIPSALGGLATIWLCWIELKKKSKKRSQGQAFIELTNRSRAAQTPHHTRHHPTTNGRP